MEFSLLEQALVSLAVVISAVFFWIGLKPRVQAILAGTDDRIRVDQPLRRAWITFKEVVFQTRVIKGRPVVGILHALVFGGFVFFGLETVDHFFKAYGLHPMEFLLGSATPMYKNFVSVWAILVCVGMIGLAYRRFVMVKISPDPKSYSSGVVAILILVLMLTYLYSQGSPTPVLAKVNWWVHALVIVVFPHLLLRSKHFHIIMAPINIFFRTSRLAELTPMDLDIENMDEDEEPSFGLETIADLSWKLRMDFLSCVECRRCTDNCPANLSGQELDPRGFILAGREAILELGADEPVIGNVISETALGQCTSCGACEDNCPVGIEHLQLLTGAKRAQALALGTGMVADGFLNSVERTGNPFGQQATARKKLIADLELPIYQSGQSEYLLWLGCVWTYNNDALDSLRATVKILEASGVSYGVLETESCSGHHSRRQGEEMQFQTLATENIDRFKGQQVDKVIAPCPHCLHTLSNEYPTLDDEVSLKVVHHSELISELVASGRLELDSSRLEKVPTTYHDPCYLGRYEGVFEAPRQALRSAGLPILEMDRSGDRAMCCGGGNAGFAAESEEKQRVDQTRKDHVKATGAELLVTGCPECKMMLNSAVDQTKDLAQVIAEAMPSEAN